MYVCVCVCLCVYLCVCMYYLLASYIPTYINVLLNCRNFHFKLHPDISLFSNDFKLTVNGRFQRTADMSVYYSGKAVGTCVFCNDVSSPSPTMHGVVVLTFR